MKRSSNQDLQELIHLANSPEPIIKKAVWEAMVVMPNKPVTARMIESLVKKSGYMGVIKGSLRWDNKPQFNRNDYSIERFWSMKGIDPESKESYDIEGMFKIRMNTNLQYEAWVGVHF